MPDDRAPLTANQLVGYNLARIRKALGLSQDEAADRLEPYLGTRWSKNVYSAAERSYDGTRVRQFTADEVVAMSLAFGVPVGYFLLPPRPEDRRPGSVMVSGATDVEWSALIVAANGYNYGPAVLMRLRELPPADQPTWPPADAEAQRYASEPGAQDPVRGDQERPGR